MQLNEEQFTSILWSNINEEFKKDIKDHTLDSLYFLMMVAKKFPATVQLKKLVGSSEILSEDNIHAVCDKLLVSYGLLQ